jgi:hypothetical protein
MAELSDIKPDHLEPSRFLRAVFGMGKESTPPNSQQYSTFKTFSFKEYRRRGSNPHDPEVNGF